jgi:quinol monooxygenase YgiN
MILRILTARVPNQNIGEFNELLRAQLAELHHQSGLVYAKLARRLAEDQTEEVVLVEEWRTTADLFEWTRGRLTAPRLLPGTEALVEDLVIAHYEALDVSPEDLQRRVLGVGATGPSDRPMGTDPAIGLNGTSDGRNGTRDARPSQRAPTPETLPT